MKKMSEKTLKKRGGKAYSTFSAPRKPLAKRGAAKAKREARFKKYLASPVWKKLRLAVFERDGFRCTANVDPGDTQMRCQREDETRTGKGLICDHLTYRRFGNERLEDLRTLCKNCNDRITTQTRANWMR
jgi:5-methylcytosine-specific restriction endonuclease McrA